MAIDVLIKRSVKPGQQAMQLVPLILKMRAMAISQPGYISGETLCNVNDPGQCLVVSRWETIDDWNRWLNSNHRNDIEQKIESLVGQKTDYEIYAPMVPR